MATIIQSAGATDGAGTATSEVASFGSTTTQRVVVACFNVFNGTTSEVTSITDDQSSAGWARVIAHRENVGSPWSLEIWATTLANPGILDVTANFSEAVYVSMSIHEISGASSVPLSNAVTNAGVASPTSGAAISSTVRGIHLAASGGTGAGRSWAPSSGWTEVIEVDEANAAGGTLVVQMRTADISTSQTPSWTYTGATMDSLIIHAVIADRRLQPVITLPLLGV